MAAIVTFHSFFCIAFVSILYVSGYSITEAKYSGFSVDLIHRNSPKSPFYDPSLTPQQKLNNALKRSFSRAKHFSSLNSPVSGSTEVIPDVGEYVMKLSIGTPPVEFFAIVDTGSDLTWVQCLPCSHCYKQKAPLLSPNSSSSYKGLSCSSGPCPVVRRSSCNPTTKACLYRISYADKSFTVGDLATETVRLGPVSLPNIIFGCGHNQQGTFSPGGAGIVGLGGGKTSLISQMNGPMSRKFSYCLVYEETASSKINFGDTAVVLGSDVISTPIVIKSPETYYWLTLDGISVEGERLDFNNSLPSSNVSKLHTEGNIIIDSGTLFTILPPDLYNPLESAVRKAINLPTIHEPQAKALSLCYANLPDKVLPNITMHFRGADVKLGGNNTFVSILTTTTTCLAFQPTNDIPIYGNLVQNNFLVGYDLEKKLVSFKPTDCSKQ